jgi:hypothetical protein
MALGNPGDLLADTVGTQEICSLLCMQDRMGCPPADIVEHRTFTHQINPDKVIERCVSERNIPDSPAMSDYLFAASCFMQQVLTAFIRLVWHDPVIF